MTKKLYLIVLIIILYSCGEKKWYSEKKICECYSKSELDILSDFDSKLSKCLTDFNNGLNTNKLNITERELKELGAEKFFELLKDLMRNCPNYRQDFDKISLKKYSQRDQKKLKEKIDSISFILKTDKNSTNDIINLAEYRILNNEMDLALNLVNQVIKINPEIEGSYFVRSFIYHKKGLINKSIEDYKKLKKITKNSDRKKWSELMIINLQQQVK